MSQMIVLLNGANAGTSIRLQDGQDQLTVGRDLDRDFPLDDDLCSRLHARIRWDGIGWEVEDCGSRNGTQLNGRSVVRARLAIGDLIRMGDRLLMVVADEREVDRLPPAQLAASTFAVRVASPGNREFFSEQLRLESSNRSVRDASILYRFSRDLHSLQETAELWELVCRSVEAGTDSHLVAVYLLGSAGRTRVVASRGGEEGMLDEVRWTASVAIEQDEATLLPVEHDSTADRGSWMIVPVPGRAKPMGAVIVHRSAGRPSLSVDDLNLVIALAQNTGLAFENLQHRERIEQANEQLRVSAKTQNRLVGTSGAIHTLMEQIERIGPADSNVLILGESGTGKELVAQTIHELSSRKAGPCVAVNCAAYSESLLESELFGHEKGAFTGAEHRRLGQFERAHRGTIFLDEVGELSPVCQAKLLRVIEGYSFERVGGTDPLSVDVRVLAATHRDLNRLVAENEFREDLLFRLRVIELVVPPIRERGEDILVLADHFLEHFFRQTGRGPRRLSVPAAQRMLKYDWPGNVRELRNAIERAVVLGTGEEVDPADLHLDTTTSGKKPDFGLVSLADAEGRHIENVLRHMKGNKTKACQILEIGRGTLYKKLKALGQ